MHSNSNINNKQNFWCRNKYCQHLNTVYTKPIFKETNGCILKECKTKSTECRGAHDESSVKILPHIYKFNCMKKDNIDWVKLYLGIFDSIQNDKSKIYDLEHKQRTSDLTKYNFIELIQLWRELSCYYRKIGKSLPNKSDLVDSEMVENYKYNDDVPKFNLSDNIEDIAWSFERLTRLCPIEEKFNNNINNNILITIWDICIATGINCKEGVHKKNEMICTNDFLTGRCNCQSIEQINDQIINYKKQIEVIKQMTEDTTWIVKKNKKKSDNDPKLLILSLESNINNLKNSRIIHYTELGMIPFTEQYKNYLLAEKIRKEELKILEQLKLEEERKELEIKFKPVIKLTKFGKK